MLLPKHNGKVKSTKDTSTSPPFTSLRKTTSVFSQWYRYPLRYIMNNRAKINKKMRNTIKRTPNSCIDLKIVSTTILSVSMRLITRRGRKARKMRKVFRKDGPFGKMVVIMETRTTMPSSQFHASCKYAPSPQNKGNATNFTSISKMKMPTKTLFAPRTICTYMASGSARGSSNIIHKVDTKMHTRMKLSNTRIPPMLPVCSLSR
mmetsp:Transcript_73106/g.184220  ORF Transcript_73106/g.184220 Transcript_73106/m.184220 type:complete len:205 (-) Transcript_73106:939-1553(-)